MAAVLQVTLPAQSLAGADVTTELGQVSTVQGTDNYLTRAELIPPPGYTTITGVATNNVTFTLRQVRAGSVLVADLASVQLVVGKNLVAETPLAFTIDATTAQQSGIQQGDVLDVLMHQNGTGLAVVAGVVCEVEVS